MTYQPKVYREQGGSRQVVASGGSLDVASGGEIDVESGGALKIAGTAITSTAAEINAVHSQGAIAADYAKLHAVTVSAAAINAAVTGGAGMTASIVVGGEVAHPTHSITCAIQLKDAAAADLAVRGAVSAYLSADASGDAVVSAVPTSVAAGTDGLYLPIEALKHFRLVSESDGDIDLVVIKTDGATTMYLILVMPSGLLIASGAITFAA